MDLDTTGDLRKVATLAAQAVRRLKVLTAEQLLPGHTRVITDLVALEAAWGLPGESPLPLDGSGVVNELDRYLGRRVEHFLGEGVIKKIEYLPNGWPYGIELKLPCHCGRKTFLLYAVPSGPVGAFERLLQPNNQDMVVSAACPIIGCDYCLKAVRKMLLASNTASGRQLVDRHTKPVLPTAMMRIKVPIQFLGELEVKVPMSIPVDRRWELAQKYAISVVFTTVDPGATGQKEGIQHYAASCGIPFEIAEADWSRVLLGPECPVRGLWEAPLLGQQDGETVEHGREQPDQPVL